MYNPKPAIDPKFTFPLQCVWLKLNGSWPLRKPAWTASTFNMLYTLWSWYVLFSVALTIGYQTAFLFHIFGDLAQTTENCCTTFMGMLNFVRLLHLRLQQPQFRRIISTFARHMWITKHTHPTVQSECERAMRTFRIISMLLSCLITLYCIMPLIELATTDDSECKEKPFPYKMIFPYDAQHGWRYTLTYAFTAYAGICVVTTLFAEDSIFGLFITYTCGHFRILHQEIDEIIPKSHAAMMQQMTLTPNDKPLSMRVYQKECLRRLAHIAYKHNQLVEFARTLEQFFSPILLVNFVISSILICMVGFQLATGKNMFIGDYIKFFVYLFSSLSQLYVLCWTGDVLIQYAADTATHLYNCNWECGVDTHISKFVKSDEIVEKNAPLNYYPVGKVFGGHLQIMLMFSQRQVRISAMKFSTLSLQSFTKIISTSMSYFTLLKSLYDDGEI